MHQKRGTSVFSVDLGGLCGEDFQTTADSRVAAEITEAWRKGARRKLG